VAPDLQNRWHRFWVVCIFRCASASPKIPDFLETPGKSPEYPGFTNKIVLSGDFQDSPIHPPLGDIKILSVMNMLGAPKYTVNSKLLNIILSLVFTSQYIVEIKKINMLINTKNTFLQT
jgi:hypothetical protein